MRDLTLCDVNNCCRPFTELRVLFPIGYDKPKYLFNINLCRVHSEELNEFKILKVNTVYGLLWLLKFYNSFNCSNSKVFYSGYEMEDKITYNNFTINPAGKAANVLDDRYWRNVGKL